jgi:ComF family protein
LCGPCRSGSLYFRRARAESPYLDDVRLSLHALKFGGRRRIASVLGSRASRSWVVAGELDGAAAVVPVPLSRRRRRERGFNQAELIARAVAREAGLPLESRILRKIREAVPQAGLSASARRKNVRSAYRARLPRSHRGKTLLLVDDVLTTGATAESAASALLAAGAGAVDVLTLARVP